MAQGSKATFALSVWKLQTQIWRLTLRHNQGRFRLAFLQQSVASFANRTIQQKLNKSVQEQLKETNDQIRSLTAQVQQTQRHVKTKERLSELGQQKLQQMDRLLRQLRKQLQTLKKQPYKTKSSKQQLQKMHLQLREESIEYQRITTKITAPDTPEQVNLWQQCQIQSLQESYQRTRVSQGMLWGGLATLGVGLAGIGVGSYLYVTSYNAEGLRPAEATFQRQAGLGTIVGGGGAVLGGGVLLLSQLWVRPNKQERSRSILKCPPRRLFPTASRTITQRSPSATRLGVSALPTSSPLPPNPTTYSFFSSYE